MSGASLAIALFLVLAFLGLPIAFCFGVTAMVWLISHSLPASILASRTFGAIDSFPLLAIPFFIYCGDLMRDTGVSRGLIDLAFLLLRRVKGALAHVTVVACMFFGAISGASAATVAAIGGVMIPGMVEKGYDRAYASALAAASGFLGIMIPPSIVLVVYALSAQVSVGAIFLATVIPGCLMGLGFMVVNWFLSDKYLDAPRGQSGIEWTPGEMKVGRVAKEAVPAVVAPVIILGGILSGMFTPTEAGAVAVVYSMLVGLFYYRSIGWKDLWKTGIGSALSSAVILTIIAFAGIFGWVVTTQQVPKLVADFVTSITTNRYLILAMVNIALFILGMIMETVTAVVITTPILLPLLTSVGMDPVHIGVMLQTNLCVGLITPPMALNVLLACRIGNVSVAEIVKPLWPYLGVAVAVTLLVAYVPQLSLFLPNMLLK